MMKRWKVRSIRTYWCFSMVKMRVLYSMGLSATTDDFEQNQLFGLQYGYVGNMSIRDFTGNLVAALVDKDGNTKEFISSEEPVTIEIERGVGQEIPCTITKAIAPGDRIRLLYKSSDGSEWKWVRGGGNTTGEILVAATRLRRKKYLRI